MSLVPAAPPCARAMATGNGPGMTVNFRATGVDERELAVLMGMGYPEDIARAILMLPVRNLPPGLQQVSPTFQVEITTEGPNAVNAVNVVARLGDHNAVEIPAHQVPIEVPDDDSKHDSEPEIKEEDDEIAHTPGSVMDDAQFYRLCREFTEDWFARQDHTEDRQKSYEESQLRGAFPDLSSQ